LDVLFIAHVARYFVIIIAAKHITRALQNLTCQLAEYLQLVIVTYVYN